MPSRTLPTAARFTAFIGMMIAAGCVQARDRGPDEASLRAADAAQMRAGAASDADAYAELSTSDFVNNAPDNRVATRAEVLAMLREGRIASEGFERTIEHVAIHGSTGVVMGRQQVTPAQDSIAGRTFGARPLVRRFTNVFVFEGGRWRLLARHANVVPQAAR